MPRNIVAAALLLVFVALLLPNVDAHDGHEHAAAAAEQCPGGRDKVTAQRGSNFPPRPASCMPSGFPLNRSTELGIFIPVVLSSGAFLPPTLPGVFSSLWAMSNAAFAAVAPYTSKGKPTISTGIARRPIKEHTTVNRNTALVYAALQVAKYISPGMGEFVKSQITALKLPTSAKCVGAPTTPACIGIRAGNAAVSKLKGSGWNNGGCQDQEYNCQPFNDYTRYAPKNTAYKLSDIYRWQPILETDGNGFFFPQGHFSPHMGTIKPFVLTEAQMAARKSVYVKPTLAQYKAQADAVISANAAMGKNETQRMICEVFDSAEWVFDSTVYYAMTRGWTLPKILSFYQVTSLFHDSTTIMIREKIRHDTVRPQSVIRYLYGDKKITAWAGVGKGTQKICGNEWISYTRTAPEAEFPSGAVCICTIAVEWIEKFIGTKQIDLPWKVAKGCSKVEPGISPKKDVSGVFKTAQELIQACEQARISTGVHFPAATAAAVKVCSGMGYQAYNWFQSYTAV